MGIYKRIDHTEIIVPDLEDSIDFYRSVLDFKLVEQVELEEHDRIKELAFIKLGDNPS